jgi:hypothetical protein
MATIREIEGLKKTLSVRLRAVVVAIAAVRNAAAEAERAVDELRAVTDRLLEAKVKDAGKE